MHNKDIDMDGIISDDISKQATLYADALTTQLKKGLLAYCVLLACQSRAYTSEIIDQLGEADLSVVEGTVYPILSRLQKDGLLSHIWQESPHGPPRKYYLITDYGTGVARKLSLSINSINQAIKKLERKKS